MDNRLDFYNYLREHKKTLTKDDILIVVAYNEKQKDCVIQTHGQLDKITHLFKKEALNSNDQSIFTSKFNLSTFMLEASLEMCLDNEKVAKLMIQELLKKYKNEKQFY